MRSFTSALALGLTLGLAPLALADGGCPGACPEGAQVQGPVQLVDDGDEDEAIAELEKQLNDLLLVDEGGMIVLREEFLAMLPEDVPAERIQMMLGALVELDPEGNFRFRNREMMRPYLPMLRKFLDQGGMDRLRDMEGLSPAERERALRDMMEGGDIPSPQPQAQERYSPKPEMSREALESRVAELEERLARLEGQQGGERGLDRRGGRLLGRMGGLGKRVRVWRDGLRKLGELMTPDDLERLRDMVQNMNLAPEDLQNPEGLLGKLQQGMAPQDLPRFMEIFSNFIASPEGREFVAELEQTVERLEGFVNSPQGKRLGEAFQDLQSRSGDGEGRASGLMKRLQDLIQGRDKPDRSGADHRQERTRRHANPERSHRQHPEGVQPPVGSKLY